MRKVIIDGNSLTPERVAEVALNRTRVEIAPEVHERLAAGRAYIGRLLAQHAVVYGITTGFGKFSEVEIGSAESLELQRNLVLSHCCGLGDPLPADCTRAVMLLRANVLAKGFSGVRPVVLETLVQLLNQDVLPVIPAKGSVGASGDLAPLAHLTAVLIGEGEATYKGERMPGARALAAAGVMPVTLEAKEGLALINGTQVMTAQGVLALRLAELTAKAADIAGAMSLEALRGTDAPYRPLTHRVRPHPGQQAAARNMLALLAGSEVLPSHGSVASDHKVQDSYSLRCIPQVHGAAKDALAFARQVLEVEINSATDNPLIFADEDQVISGGNFHGQPVAQALDLVAIGLAYLAGISERRMECMLDPATSDHLPPFLTLKGGLNSGLMIAQVAAAALVSENKVLAHPACVDSIPTSANKEDYVSMGAHAARKAMEVAENACRVVAIELLCAAQALEFRRGLRPGRGVEVAHELIRRYVEPLEEDRPLSPDMESVSRLVASGELVQAVEEEVGSLEPTDTWPMVLTPSID
ncbi:MAG: Histidine ammonia-lyase [Actinobacteria bacterium ADurb.Bin444]|nr:MAG: Histidine ammonia-lyase [Actinobacteria bacterium ADurb.Bin444]